MVSVHGDIARKHLIKFPISTDLKKVRKSVEYSQVFYCSSQGRDRGRCLSDEFQDILPSI